MKTYLLWLTAVLLFGGCSITREVPPAVAYQLRTPGTAALPSPTRCRKHVLRVALLQSPKWLRGTDIYYSAEANRMYRYTRARWQIPPTDRLQQIVENALSDSGIFATVVPYKSLAKNDLLLETRLEALSQTVTDKGKGRTEFKAYAVLIEQYSRRVVSQKTFVYRQEQERGDVQSAMQAWSEDAARFENDLIAWLGQVCETVGNPEHGDAAL